jgi:dTDP-4-amino-4,6-dideoxygalactose transaminase
MPSRRRVEFLSARTRSASRVVLRLQRWWRAWRRMLPTNNTEESSTLWRVRAGGRDVRCPISQDSIELAQCFRFVTASGHVVAFAADALAAYLAARGIGTGIHYPVPIHLQPAMSPSPRPGRFPVAERLAGRILSLPMFAGITAAEVDAVCDAVAEFGP